MILVRTENITEREMIAGKHHFPFDNVHGFKNEDGSIMTAEQVEQFGVLVDNIPEPENIDGKASIGYINCFTKEIWYEYVDTPSQLQTQEEKIAQLEGAVMELTTIIASLTGGAN